MCARARVCVRMHVRVCVCVCEHFRMFSTQRNLRKAAVIALSECTVFKLLVKLLAPYKIFISSIHRVEHFILFQLASSTKIGDLVDSSDWGDIQVKLQRKVLDTIAKEAR